MKTVGIICEFNPFHNGHVYFINKVKELYPDSLIVLVLGGYFLERGDVSLISKWNKTRLALEFGVDLVLELPALYNTNSADHFAYHSIDILNEAQIDVLVFGSESNDLAKLKIIASSQNDPSFNSSVRSNLKKGLNYPSSLSKSLDVRVDCNDILGIAYIKAVQKINPNIEINLVKRTNSFNDIHSNDDIISASNIREKIKNNIPIEKFIPGYDSDLINKIDEDKMFELLRYRILSDSHLEQYLGVDEGLENRLKKSILNVNSYDELLESIRSKRYTISRLKRMLVHLLLGIEKKDMEEEHSSYKILGFNARGQEYLKNLNGTKLTYKPSGKIAEIERRASLIYGELTHDKSVTFEFLNRPIIKRKR